MNTNITPYTFDANPKDLFAAREFVRTSLASLNINNQSDIVIAVGEALQNIVRHAYANTTPGHLSVIIKRDENIVEITIHDDAPTGNPEVFLSKKYSPSESGGMGIQLINKIALEFVIHPHKDGNTTILKFKA